MADALILIRKLKFIVVLLYLKPPFNLGVFIIINNPTHIAFNA